jgi:hypothetical protein
MVGCGNLPERQLAGNDAAFTGQDCGQLAPQRPSEFSMTAVIEVGLARCAPLSTGRSNTRRGRASGVCCRRKLTRWRRGPDPALLLAREGMSVVSRHVVCDDVLRFTCAGFGQPSPGSGCPPPGRQDAS